MRLNLLDHYFVGLLTKTNMTYKKQIHFHHKQRPLITIKHQPLPIKGGTAVIKSVVMQMWLQRQVINRHPSPQCNTDWHHARPSTSDLLLIVVVQLPDGPGHDYRERYTCESQRKVTVRLSSFSAIHITKYDCGDFTLQHVCQAPSKAIVAGVLWSTADTSQDVSPCGNIS